MHNKQLQRVFLYQGLVVIEVFGEAVLQRATAILVAHNHPSGNLESSMEDKDVTRRLKQAGDILGIKVLDHLIFGEEGYLSMLEGNVF
ncbi:JAB domain-containing protein [Sphaerochaeta halotolerans]|uniref:JAB domain-containing protein n=1 Tax=Sphaerochaeta halotolerans TaxID=2293840 RepID=UPI001F0B8A9B|nr:JAB domain-containing protein [Sphaerochaeta halotolerans]